MDELEKSFWSANAKIDRAARALNEALQLFSERAASRSRFEPGGWSCGDVTIEITVTRSENGVPRIEVETSIVTEATKEHGLVKERLLGYSLGCRKIAAPERDK